MPPNNKPSIALRFENLNRETRNVKSFRIQSSYMTSTDAFDVTIYEPKVANIRGLELQPVTLYLDGNIQMLGRVERTTIGASGLAIQLSGRDYIADLVESHVDMTLKIKKGETLGKAIELAAGPVGIISVTGDRGVIWRNARTGANVRSGGKAPVDFVKVKQDEYKPKPGEGTYQFCNRLAARHGATIQPMDDRTVLNLTAPDYEQETIGELFRSFSKPPGASNNIVSGVATRNYSKFPTFTKGVGKVPKGGKKSTLSFTQEVDLSTLPATGLVHEGRIKPSEGPKPAAEQYKLYRMLYIKDEQAKNAEQLDKACLRAIAERSKDFLQYQATVKGHQNPATGFTWGQDTLVYVKDEVCDIDEPLWVESVTFEYDEERGATTQLICWRPGAFII